MVFGVFDVLHDGHRFLLTEAKKLGDKLIAVLPPDSIVLKLKGRPARNLLPERITNLEALKLADLALAGDEELGAWNVIRKHKPDIIALGYDQKDLAFSIAKFLQQNNLSVEQVFIKPFAGGKIHSSVIIKG